MRSIAEFSLEEIKQGLNKARDTHGEVNDYIRILFAPVDINEANFERVCDIYGRLDLSNYETAVIVEVHSEVLEKKIPMPSNRQFRTPFGEVPVNDYLRNELCDEDDDFFIHDEAFSQDMSLFQQLAMLQGLGDDDIKALSVQIADENHFIIKELAHTLEEVLASRNTLLIFCCDLDGSRKKEFKRVKNMIDDQAHSNLLNYLNSGESHIRGTGAFITGILIAQEWNLRINFLDEETTDASLLTAYADRERKIF